MAIPTLEIAKAKEGTMTPVTKAAIKFACAKAIHALGENYKGMTCFLFNWKVPSQNDVEETKKAA